jgi:hypothetical protein
MLLKSTISGDTQAIHVGHRSERNAAKEIHGHLLFGSPLSPPEISLLRDGELRALALW